MGRNPPIVTRNILTLVAAATTQEHIGEIVLDLLFLRPEENCVDVESWGKM